MTKSIEGTYVVNTVFRSRVIFLVKHNCDINQLKFNEKWLTFDRKKDSFVKRSLNSAKQGWDNKIRLIENSEVLSLDKTVSCLNNLNNNDIFGKSKNRTLLSLNPNLFKSIMKYSVDLEKLNPSSKKFPARVIFIRDYEGCIENIICPICKNNYCLYNEQKKMFNKTCKGCYHSSVFKYPQKEWFINNYGENWVKYFTEDRDKIKSIKVNSEKWFIEKYGVIDGNNLRKSYIQNKLKTIIRLKTNGVSKISQELFWEIYNNLPNRNNCFFHELNKEIMIRNENIIYFPDFVYGNKIIEYDGWYWHNEERDRKRKRQSMHACVHIYTCV